MLYTNNGDIMEVSVVCEENLLEYGQEFATNLKASLSTFSDDVELESTVVLIFNGKLGRTSLAVSNFEQKLVNKHVAIFCYGNTGFDIGRLYKRFLKQQSSLLIYSKYFTKLDVAQCCHDLQTRRIETDGNSFNEKFIGSICRLIFRANI